jgi:hypothetical protein
MHATWPDELYADAAWPVALACLELLSDEARWIHRRVETVDLLAQELVRRQVTVEFTLPEPLLEDLRIGPDGPWCLPIAILEKQPLRNFDLLEDDEWRPILGREHNGPIAAALVLAAARLAIGSDTVDAEVVHQLDRVAQGDLDDARAALTALRRRAQHDPQVAAILEDDTSGYFVETLATNYMLIALLAEPRRRRILKYSYDEHLRFIRGRPGRARRVAARLGWSALVIDVAVPTAAHTASYHAEVVVPEELRIDAFVLDTGTDELLSTDIERGVDRAALHAPGVSLDADPLLTVAVSAERSGVPTLAFVISAVTTLLLLLGAAVGRLDSPTAGSSVTVLLAGSVLFAATVARGGEHRLVRGIFVGQRWLLSMTALAALAAAASVAFGADAAVRDAIWYAAGAASALACLGLALAFRQAEPLQRKQDEPGSDDRT